MNDFIITKNNRMHVLIFYMFIQYQMLEKYFDNNRISFRWIVLTQTQYSQ